MKLKEQIKAVKSIFTERGFEPREHSVKNIVGKYLAPILAHVIAIGTSGGKTFTMAAKLEFLYKFGFIKSHQKVMILAADKSILRSNFYQSFDSFFEIKPASFSYRAVRGKKQLRQALEDGIQVIITIPQTIAEDNTLNLLSQFNWARLIQDEGHKWYFAVTTQRIINALKPDGQILLTGTPFKFNMANYRSENPRFIIEYTSVREMYQLGYLSDFTGHVLHSKVALKKLDYASILGNLKKDKRFGKLELEEAFNDVVNGIIKKLKLPLKNLATAHNISKNISSVFGTLQKTIIFTHGIAEANALSEYLKINGVGSVVTHSQTRDDSNDIFNTFKEDKNIKVLVAVNQGKEGFDFPELYNVIDMTFSYNFEVVMQMIGRILRKSDLIKNKHFFKVASKHEASYMVNWMNAMFMLFDEEWYSRFDGKNGFDIPIFRERKSTSKERGNNGPRGSRPTSTIHTNLESFLSLEFMEKNSYFKLNDSLSTVAHTTLGEIVRKLKSDKALEAKAKRYINDALRSVNTQDGATLICHNRKFKSDDFYISEFASKNNLNLKVSKSFLKKPLIKLEKERSNVLSDFLAI
jgi:superfamily II DNA or RNA helicase